MNRTRIEAIAKSICARVCDGRRSLDELLVIDRLIARVELGADRYGPLDLTKQRDWDRELAEEAEDLVVYRAIANVLHREYTAVTLAPALSKTEERELFAFDMEEL